MLALMSIKSVIAVLVFNVGVHCHKSVALICRWRRVISFINIAVAEIILQKVSSLVKERERNNGLGNANALSAKDSPHAKGAHIRHHFLAGRHNTNALSLNTTSLHNDFQTTQGIGDHDVNGTDDGTGDQPRDRTSHASLVAEFALNVLLQPRLSNESQYRRGQRVSHERHRSTKERGKLLCRRLFQNFPNGFDRARLFKVGALLLFNHTNGIDKGSAEDGSGGGGGKSWIFTFPHEKGETEQHTKLGYTLKADPDQTGSDSTERSGHWVTTKDCFGFLRGDLWVYRLAVRILGVLLH